MIKYHSDYALSGTYTIAKSENSVFIIGDGLEIVASMTLDELDEFLENESCTNIWLGDCHYTDGFSNKVYFNKDI